MTAYRLAVAGLVVSCAAACSAESEQSIVPHTRADRGALEVKGDARDWFAISRGGKNVGGNPPMLNTTRELEPGDYEVSVNKTVRKVKIEAGKKTVLVTGSLVVEGSGANWWYPEQDGERKTVANPPLLGRPLALFSGTYAVRVHAGNRDEKLSEGAKVAPGRLTTLKR